MSTRKMSEAARTAAREAAAAKRRELLERERALDLFQRAEMLQKAGKIRTTDGAPLSPKNTIMVYLQASAAGIVPSLVGGFKQWREQGRTVRKGAKGFLICFPKWGEGGDDGSKPDGFGWGYVFDVTQTAAKGEEETETEAEAEAATDSAPTPSAVPSAVPVPVPAAASASVEMPAPSSSASASASASASSSVSDYLSSLCAKIAAA